MTRPARTPAQTELLSWPLAFVGVPNTAVLLQTACSTLLLRRRRRAEIAKLEAWVAASADPR